MLTGPDVEEVRMAERKSSWVDDAPRELRTTDTRRRS